MGAHAFTASLLRASARGFAGLTAARMAEGAPDLVGATGLDAWQAFSSRQVLSLAAAVDDEAPERFSAGIAWSREAFAARTASPEGLALALECLAAVLEESLPLVAWSILPDYFRDARAELARTGASEPPTDPAGALGELARAYLDALVAGDEPRASALAREALDAPALSVQGLIETVLVPVQRELGRRWHHGLLSVSEEHFATQATRRVLALALSKAPRVRPRQRTLVVAAVGGDAHDIALAFVAAFFELDGWRALCLGADTPISDLVAYAERHGADLVALGATLDEQRAATAEAIRALRAARPGVKVLVGGAAYAGRDDLWRRSGADGYAADGAEAVRQGRELVG